MMLDNNDNFMSSPITETHILQENPDSMKTRMELMIMDVQARIHYINLFFTFQNIFSVFCLMVTNNRRLSIETPNKPSWS